MSAHRFTSRSTSSVHRLCLQPASRIHASNARSISALRSLTTAPSNFLVRRQLLPSFKSFPSTSSSPFPSGRHLSTSNQDASVDPSISVKEMSQDEYHQISDEDMDMLYEHLESFCENYGGGQWEVEYSSGVMTLTLSPVGTYVINKQPPNQQIWVSSPISGPSRFSYSPSGAWVHHRKAGLTLGAVLNEELREVLKGARAADSTGWQGLGLK